MSKDVLPSQVNPFRYADNAATLKGVVYVNTLPRLTDSIPEQATPCSAEFHFGIDERKTRYVKGHIKANLELICQRCLEKFPQLVSSEFNIGFITKDKDSERISKAYDPLVIQDEIFNLSDLVEEELLLNLPIVPMHSTDQCPVKLPLVTGDETEDMSEATKENPFKVIEILKSKIKKD